MQAHRANWVYLLITISAVVIISAVSLAVAAEKQKPEEGNAPAAGQNSVALVNDTVISRIQFEREMDGVKQQLQAMGQPMAEEQLAELQKDILENLISTELLYQAAQKQGVEVTPAEVDEKFGSLKQRFPKEEEFAKVLAKMNITESDLKAQLGRGMVIEEFVDQQVIQKISVSDEEVKAYYEKNPALFTQPEQVRASHILIKVDKSADETQKAMARKKIEEIEQKLKEGGDFAALAKEFSQCPSSQNGGDLGFFRRGQMVKSFEDTAFSLNPGQVSPVVETQFGYHIIKVAEKKAQTILPLDEMKDRLTKYLKQEQAQKKVAEYIEGLKTNAKIEKYLEAAPATPASQEAIKE
jgi:peptidyl-prolyl cis-trans isomerase C